MRISELKKNYASVLDNLDFEVLLAHVLGVDREYLLAHDNEDVFETDIALFEQYVRAVNSGKPVGYLTQSKEFFGLNFFVDERVLLPRPETELLVEHVIDFVRKKSGKAKILDVGTGSGNIPVAISNNFKDTEDFIKNIVAIDISEDALEVARINASQHGVEHKIDFYQSDLLEVIEENEEFDVITANLPYIGENDFVDEKVKKYEPSQALFGGKIGIELYKKMFQELHEKNIKFKMMIGEFGFGQRNDVERLLNSFFDQRWEIIKDLAGVDRFFIVKN